MDSRIVDLESKVAYQDYTIAQLNDVVTRQQRQIDQLTAELKSITSRLVALAPSNIAPESEETPPPHY